MNKKCWICNSKMDLVHQKCERKETIVEKVPAHKCKKCGEIVFESKTSIILNKVFMENMKGHYYFKELLSIFKEEK